MQDIEQYDQATVDRCAGGGWAAATSDGPRLGQNERRRERPGQPPAHRRQGAGHLRDALRQTSMADEEDPDGIVSTQARGSIAASSSRSHPLRVRLIRIAIYAIKCMDRGLLRRIPAAPDHGRDVRLCVGPSLEKQVRSARRPALRRQPIIPSGRVALSIAT